MHNLGLVLAGLLNLYPPSVTAYDITVTAQGRWQIRVVTRHTGAYDYVTVRWVLWPALYLSLVEDGYRPAVALRLAA